MKDKRLSLFNRFPPAERLVIVANPDWLRNFLSIFKINWLAYSIWIPVVIGIVLESIDPLPGKIWIIFGLGLIYLAVPIAGSFFPQMDFYLTSLSRGPKDRRQVALTFDDGPDPHITPRLLDLLKQEGVPVAFFFIGNTAQNHIHLVKRADVEGHLIGNHSFFHPYNWILLSNAQIFSELNRANQVLSEILQRTPRFVRLPFGVSRPGLSQILQILNLTSVGWDARGLEGIYQNPKIIANRIARQTRNGSIILLHESYYRTQQFEPETVLETVRLTITLLRERGFTFVRLDQLLEQPGYAELDLATCPLYLESQPVWR